MIFSNKRAWHDSSIEKIIIEYNKIIVELETDSGIQDIIFENYIAFDYIGQWDENIVDAIYEENDSLLVESVLERIIAINDIKYKGGGTRNIDSDWKCYIIKLIDGVCIRIVCDNVILGKKLRCSDDE